MRQNLFANGIKMLICRKTGCGYVNLSLWIDHHVAVCLQLFIDQLLYVEKASVRLWCTFCCHTTTSSERVNDLAVSSVFAVYFSVDMHECQLNY